MAENDVVSGLSARPRTIEVVCAKDGHTYTWKDDGGAKTRDGFQPHPFRQSFIRKMALKDKDGTPLYYVKSRLTPLFTGDPFANFPVLDEAAKALVEKKVKEKRDRELRDRDQLVNEAKKQGASEFLTKLVAEVSAAAADADRKKAAAEKDKK